MLCFVIGHNIGRTRFSVIRIFKMHPAKLVPNTDINNVEMVLLICLIKQTMVHNQPLDCAVLNCMLFQKINNTMYKN